jgi:hypothetical protein
MKGGAQEEAAWNLRREEFHSAAGGMHSLDPADAGGNILTLEEAIQTFTGDQESALFRLQLRVEAPAKDPDNSLSPSLEPAQRASENFG